MRRLLAAPGLLLRAALGVLVLGGIVFVALTRTQVGRETLRLQLEGAFAQQFDGTLTLDTLAGDLVGTLDARGVTIRDARGDTVFTARRLVARPTLRGLVSRDLELREVTLTAPHVRLYRDTAAVWNVARLFRPRATPAPTSAPKWRFGAPVVRVVDGTVDLVSDAPPPAAIAAGTLADVLNQRYTHVNGQATVEWHDLRRVLQVERLHVAAPGLAFTLDDLSGQYREERRGGHTVERIFGGVRLRAGETTAEADLRLPGDGPAEGQLDGTFDARTLRLLAPRLPLAGTLRLAAAGTGTASGLTLTHFDARTGRSHVATTGRLTWSGDSLVVATDAFTGNARRDDLAALLPGLPAAVARVVGEAATLDLAYVRLALDRTNPRRYRLATAGRAVLPAGTAEGSVALAAGPDVRWRLALVTRALDVAALAGAPLPATLLTGRVDSEGRAPALDAALLRTANARVTVTLGPGQVYGRALDSLALDGRLQRGRFQSRFALRQAASAARGTLDASLVDATAPVRFDAALQGFDVGALLGTDTLLTRLTGTIAADLQGRTLDGATGTLALDLSDAALWHRDDPLLTGPLTLTLTRDATGEGHLVSHTAGFDADLTGTLQVAPWQTAGAAYLPRLVARSRALAGHRRGQPADVVLPAPGVLSPVQLRGRLALRDPALLAALGVALPVRGALTLQGEVAADTDGLRLTLDGAADTLRLGRRRLGGVHLKARLRDDGATAPALTLDARADTLLGVPLLGAPLVLQAALDGDTGTLALRTASAGGRQDGAAFRLYLLPDRLRLQVDSLAAGAAAFRFAARTGVLDVYADALVVQDVTLQADAPGTRQALTLAGTVSALPSDTLHVRATSVSLAALLGPQPERRVLDGRLDGDVALSSLLGLPEATGALTVSALTLGRHSLGDLTLASFYRPGDPDIALNVQLAPARALAPGVVPTRNELTAQGRLRLPAAGQPAALDLTVDVARAEVFFFDYLFPDLVRGTTGVLQAQSVHVTGSPTNPQFEGAFSLDGGGLHVPRFGLAYTLSGGGHLQGDTIVLDAVDGTDGTGGGAHVTGTIGFNAYRYVSLDLDARVDDLKLLDVPTSNDLPFYGRLWATGDLTLTGAVDAAVLRTSGAVVSAKSEVSIPIRETFSATDPGFIVHADSAGRLPDLARFSTRTSLFEKPTAERSFDAGLTMDLAFTVASGARLNLVLDPLRGDVMRARGAGALQLVRREGDFNLFGTLDVEGGEYLFTASDLFARQFRLDTGTLTWDGDPVDPLLNVSASYRTRASLAGLAEAEGLVSGTVPLIVRLDLRERLQSPAITLALALDRSARAEAVAQLQTLETVLNAPERRAEYATSVLLTNSFLLTTSLAQSTTGVGGAGNQFAFTSVSELVSSQLNRYLSSVVPGLELRLGVEGERTNALDVTYGVALRLLNERLIIRGEGVLASDRTASPTSAQGLQGEFVVEVRLSPAVSVEVYYRREDAVLQQVTTSTTSTTGASLAYQTRFGSWRRVFDRLLGRHPRPLAAPSDSLTAER